MKLAKELLVKPKEKVQLSKYDPDETFGAKKDLDALRSNLSRLAELQQLLYADGRHALLIVLQGLDAAGKDGTIRHVMSGVNPQGCQVTPFKAPTAEDLAHDFLWRIHKAAPQKGNIGIFNRSQYEDVLIVRVHELVAKDVWSQRYEQINEFERMLTETGTVILKFFLHISKDEQKKRIEERLDVRSKNWKLSLPDFAERKHWDEYTEAYEDTLSKCSTEWAPWYVVPANKKWFRNFAISSVIVETLEKLKLHYPKPSIDVSKVELD